MKNIKEISVGESFNYTTPEGDEITANLRDGGTMGGADFDLFVALEDQEYTEGLDEVETFDSEVEQISQ
jgi:hypothetical protein